MSEAEHQDKERAQERAIMLGRHARDVMKNPAFEAAVDSVMRDLFARFLATPAQDREERERLWAIGQQAGLLKTRLEAMIETGKLEEQNKAADRNQ